MDSKLQISPWRSAHRHPLLWLAAMVWASAAFSNPGSAPPAAAAPASGPLSPDYPSETTSFRANPSGNDTVQFSTSFRDFQGNVLSLAFAMPAAWSDAATAQFGISSAEINALAEHCQTTPGCDDAALGAEFRDYLAAHGVGMHKMDSGPARLYVDVPAVVAHSRERLTPLAEALRALALQRGEDTQWMIEAAIALIQDGIAYRQPGKIDHGRRILGFFPPARTLAQGYGDCDSKAALLAALLQNITDAPIIGVDLPGHYLLGIAGIPSPDQASLRFQGATYLLVETAGPALRRPGDVSKATLLALNNPGTMRIHPMY